MFSCKLDRPESEQHRHDDGKLLRDRSESKRQAGQDHLRDRQTTEEAEDGDRDAENHRKPDQIFGQVQGGFLHGCFRVARLLGQAGDPSKFGVHPGMYRDTRPFSFQDHASHVDHIGLVVQSRLLRDNGRILADPHGLAGELRFVDLETL